MLGELFWKTGLAAAALASATAAIAIPNSHVVHEERAAAPERWVKRARVAPDSILPVRIGLTQSNLDRGEEFLHSVSHPDSPSFGKHWTAEEVIEAFKPSDETVDAVKQWLEEAGFTRVVHSDNKGWLAFDAPASEVEALLHAEYHEYEDTISGGVLPSCDRYHVPGHIRHHIDYITPGLKLLAPNHRPKQGLKKRELAPRSVRPNHWRQSQWPDHAKGRDDLSICDTTITPACVKALYKIPEFPLDRYSPNPDNKMAIYEADLQQWDQTDMNLFFANFTPWIHNGTGPRTVSIDGGVPHNNNVTNAAINGGEILLDLQLSYPIVYPQTIEIWDENDMHYQSWTNDTSLFGFNQLLDSMDGSYCTYSAYGETGDLKGPDYPQYPDPQPDGTGYNHPLQCGVYKPPNVLSTSYGGQEVDVPIAYQKRQCNEFLKLGLQGTSFMFASGDTGVGQYPEKYGGYDGPTGCLGKKRNAFNPTWPCTCPWITAVGATELYPPNTVFEKQPESVVFDPDPAHPGLNYSSGGGFSNIYPIPSYQKSAVEGYLSKHNPPYEYYSKLAPNAPNPVHVNVTELQGSGNGLYNRIGRAYPDVSANGQNIATYVFLMTMTPPLNPRHVLITCNQRHRYQGGVYGLLGGTSASTPIFSSIINRINEERLACGKKSIGFLNHILYSNPHVLNDVTNGTNSGCAYPFYFQNFERDHLLTFRVRIGNSGGFPAAPGWDPSSGLGTPIYPEMLKLFMSLP